MICCDSFSQRNPHGHNVIPWSFDILMRVLMSRGESRRVAESRFDQRTIKLGHLCTGVSTRWRDPLQTQRPFGGIGVLGPPATHLWNLGTKHLRTYIYRRLDLR